MRVVHYTEEENFVLKKIVVKNRFLLCKPYGGIWASPVDSKYGWIQCEAGGRAIGKFEVFMDVDIDESEVITIDTVEDLSKLIWTPLHEIMEEIDKLGLVKLPHGFELIDFEKMQKEGIDVIYLTEKGQWNTRLTYPRNLYGWDCECILILNERIIKNIKMGKMIEESDVRELECEY